MTKKKRKCFEQQKARIKPLFDHWIRVLGLRWWTTEILYYDEFNPIDDHDFIFAQVHADWRYMYSTIEVWVPTAKILNDERLEEAVVHELCHMLVNELNGDHDHEERVCTTLANAILWTRDLGAKDAKSAG